jgi:hypothetical protein
MTRAETKSSRRKIEEFVAKLLSRVYTITDLQRKARGEQPRKHLPILKIQEKSWKIVYFLLWGQQ